MRKAFRLRRKPSKAGELSVKGFLEDCVSSVRYVSVVCLRQEVGESLEYWSSVIKSTPVSLVYAKKDPELTRDRFPPRNLGRQVFWRWD